MTDSDTKRFALVILSTVADSGSAGIPSGHLYAALSDKLNFDQFTTVLRTIVGMRWVTDTMHVLRVTSVGAEIAKAFDSVLAMAPRDSAAEDAFLDGLANDADAIAAFEREAGLDDPPEAAHCPPEGWAGEDPGTSTDESTNPSSGWRQPG